MAHVTRNISQPVKAKIPVTKPTATKRSVTVKVNKKSVATPNRSAPMWERTSKPKEDTEQTKLSCNLNQSAFSVDYCEPGCVIFKLSKAFDVYKKLPKPFQDGMRLAEEIVTSAAYANAVSKLFTTLYPKLILTHEEILSSVAEHFLIDSCRIGVDMDAFMCVRRGEEELVRVIYLNMNLFNQMFTAENTTGVLYALFVAVKLAHECTHILHFIFSGDLRNSKHSLTPALRYKPDNKAHAIDAIGDALELELFGGLVRLIEGEGQVKGVKESMRLKQLVSYPFLSAHTRKVIKPKQDFSSSGGSYKLSTAEVFNEPCKAVYHPMVHARNSAREIPASAMKLGAVRY